jgi:Fe-S-cluster containining protein
MIFRELDCPEKCGACCKRYALNYLPDETKRVKEATLEFKVKVNEKEFLLFSDLQQDHTGDWCRNLDVVTGRCMHYEERAFECDLPPLQVNQYKQHNLLTSRGLGRAWALKKIDGTKGALSKMKPLNDISVADTRRKLDRLKQWADYFTLDTWMPEIVAWAMSDPYKIRELRLGF